MTASIRGQQGLFKAYQDGEEQVFDAITRISINQDSTFSRSFYVGNNVPEGDQAIEGWSGQVEAEVKNAAFDEFIDGLVTDNLNGIGVSEYTFIHTEKYADGTSKSYVYFDCQWRLSKENGGLNEKMTKRLDFQASGRIPL
jgi:hypothetical protein